MKIYKISFLLVPFIILLSSLSCSQDSEIQMYKINPQKIETKKSIPQEHKIFLANMLPLIQYENDSILLDRKFVKEILQDIKNDKNVSGSEKSTIDHIFIKYDLSKFNWENSNKAKMIASLDSLLLRVDIIPIKLVMAQAIIESGWGSSRFAKDAYNYFGIHCYTPGCGIKPDGIEDSKFEVKKFSSIRSAIQNYLHILNTGYAYEHLRKVRSELRVENKPLDPIKIAQGLEHYSQIGDEYTTLISEIITNYLPENIEALFEKTNP
ncbi:glucosaminidase domain-containing protein, partial [Bacteroidota bacterium]